MKLIPVMLLAVIALPPFSSQAQEMYTFPFAEGNFLRYRIEDGGSSSDTSSILSFWSPWLEFPDQNLIMDSIVIMRTGPRVYDMRDAGWVKITSEGIFVISDSSRGFEIDGQREYEYLPVFPPADTVTLYNKRITDSTTEYLSARTVRLLRMFDTTVAESACQAFSMRIDGADGTEEMVIADGFGLVRIQRWDSGNNRILSAYLSGFVINDRRWNWDPVQRNFLPLCDSDVRQYRKYVIEYWPENGDTTYYQSKEVHDAGIISGEHYFSFGDLYLRSEQSGIFSIDSGSSTPRKRLLLPSHAEPGCIVNTWRIYDTATVTVFGKQQTCLFLTFWASEGSISDGPEMYETWADSFGMISSFTGCHGCMFYPTDDFVSLTYASICGTEYGTPTGVQPMDQIIPDQSVLKQNYPNPFNPTTTIQYTLEHSQRVSLSVTDIYGREVRRVFDGEFKKAGTHQVQFDAAGLPSGVYFYSLIAGGRHSTKKMVVVR